MSTPAVARSVWVAWVAGWGVTLTAVLDIILTGLQSAGDLTDWQADALGSDFLAGTLLIAVVPSLPALVVGFAVRRAVRGQPLARAVVWVITPFACWLDLAGLALVTAIGSDGDAAAAVPVVVLSALGRLIGVACMLVAAVALVLPSAREHVRAAGERARGGPASPWTGYTVIRRAAAVLTVAFLLECAAVALWAAVATRLPYRPDAVLSGPGARQDVALLVAGLGAVPLLATLLGAGLVARLRSGAARAATFAVGVASTGLAVPGLVFLAVAPVNLQEGIGPAHAGVVPIGYAGSALAMGAFLLLGVALVLLGAPSVSALVTPPR